MRTLLLRRTRKEVQIRSQVLIPVEYNFNANCLQLVDLHYSVNCSLQASIQNLQILAKSEKSDENARFSCSFHEHQIPMNYIPQNEYHVETNSTGKLELEANGKLLENLTTYSHQGDKFQTQSQSTSSYNVDLVPQAINDMVSETSSKASKTSVNSDELDEKAKCPVVQQKGRFKVTSENVNFEKVSPSPILQKSHSMQVITPHPGISMPVMQTEAIAATPPNILNHLLYPVLQSILQTNIVQRESILSLMKQLSSRDSTVDGGCTSGNTTTTEKSLLEAAHDREKELLREVTDLQWRLICAQEELQKYKTENVLAEL